MAKARILVVHRLPAEVRRGFPATAAALNTEDRVISASELILRAGDFDALLISSMFKCRADVINALPASIRMITTFSVGTDHIDIPAAKARNIAVSIRPMCLPMPRRIFHCCLCWVLHGARVGATAWCGRTDGRHLRWLLRSDLMSADAGSVFSAWDALARQWPSGAAFNMELHYHNRKQVDASLEHGASFIPL
jgi:glyoxylate reductase